MSTTLLSLDEVAKAFVEGILNKKPAIMPGDAGFVSSIPPWRLIPQPEEQRVREEILQEAAAGKSLRAIARGLDAAGIPSRFGRGWSHQTIASIVRRARRPSGKRVGICAVPAIAAEPARQTRARAPFR